LPCCTGNTPVFFLQGVFVDRDSKWFGVILNYMRTGKLLVDGSQISDVALEEIAYV
jgi:hypothetical protein